MRARGKADLVVVDDMNRAAGAVAAKRRKGKGLGNNALSGEGGIAMQQDSHDFLALGIPALFLLGPHPADHDRIDDLEMRRVRRKAEMNGLAVELAVRRCAHVIFHIARSTGILGVCRVAQKLGDDRAERLAEDIMQDVQTAAMRHADHNLADAELRAALQDLLQRRDHRLAAIDSEPLGAGIFLVKVLFELLGIHKALIDRLLAPLGEVGAVADGLDTLLNPRLLRRVLHMHELDADGAAIGFAERLDNLAQGRRLETENIIDEDRAIPVGVGEAIGRRIKLGMKRLGFQRQRIEIGQKMPADPVGAYQHHRAERVQCRGTHVTGVHMPPGGMAGSHGIHRIGRVGRPDDAAAVAGPAGTLLDFGAAVPKRVETLEISGPAAVDGRGITPPRRVHLGYEGGIRRRQEGQIKLVRLPGLARHLSRVIHEKSTCSF